MIKSKKTIYLLKINNNIRDIVYGMWGSDKKVSVGLEDHSISFPVKGKIEESKSEINFESEFGDKVTLSIMTKEIYDSIKGFVIPEQAPRIANDQEAQDVFWDLK